MRWFLSLSALLLGLVAVLVGAFLLLGTALLSAPFLGGVLSSSVQSTQLRDRLADLPGAGAVTEAQRLASEPFQDNLAYAVELGEATPAAIAEDIAAVIADRDGGASVGVVLRTGSRSVAISPIAALNDARLDLAERLSLIDGVEHVQLLWPEHGDNGFSDEANSALRVELRVGADADLAETALLGRSLAGPLAEAVSAVRGAEDSSGAEALPRRGDVTGGLRIVTVTGSDPAAASEAAAVLDADPAVIGFAWREEGGLGELAVADAAARERLCTRVSCQWTTIALPTPGGWERSTPPW